MRKVSAQFKNSPLNKRLQEIYAMKKVINNSKIELDLKNKLMHECDLEIDRCWQRHHAKQEGYELS